MFVGLGGVAVSLYDLDRCRRAVAWPTVQGVVVWSQVEEVSNEGISYFPRIVYTYEVQGSQYRGRALNPAAEAAGGGDKNWAQQIVNRYPLKSAVKVYYNPADPNDAILEPGVQRRAYMPVFFALFFAAAGGVMWVMNSPPPVAPKVTLSSQQGDAADGSP
jgi:hypothetical protein